MAQGALQNVPRGAWVLATGFGGKEPAGKGRGVWHGIGITTLDGWDGRGMMRG